MNIDLQTIRITTAYIKTYVGDVWKNCEEIKKVIAQHQDSDIIVLPELCVTGYSCGDLFNQDELLDAAAECLDVLTDKGIIPPGQLVVVGLPMRVGNGLYNCAAVLCGGEYPRGIVPKTYLPNSKEFYEARWFQSGNQLNHTHVQMKEKDSSCTYIVPFGTDLLFYCRKFPELKIGIEICEDLWAPIPPSSFQALAGANILLNLSASPENVAKAPYRRNLVEQQSGRCLAAYAYCSCGPTESTTDVVFGGHCLIADNGNIVAETERFKEEDSLTVDLDYGKLLAARRGNPTFNLSQNLLSSRTFRHEGVEFRNSKDVIKVNAHPFIPNDSKTMADRCWEILNIQSCGLAKRWSMLPNKNVCIGVSGGLDSTLALLVAVYAAKRLGYDPKLIHGVTMPGFGTSGTTLKNAKLLMEKTGISLEEVGIRDLCMQTFRDLGHKPFGLELDENFDRNLQHVSGDDLVFENVQARLRTMLLMSKGFVVGTGDLSEAALGWCTYNGDHMSMYNVNASVPKTLVKFLVKYVADTTPELKDVLEGILGTVVSPELLPLKDGRIVQSTEDKIGPYELHDFFLYHFIKNGFGVKKIAALAFEAFDGKYRITEVKQWLDLFFKRFFTMAFKRSCMPDGPKIGSVSLSPRGDWRMPSDMSSELWKN